ncbi:MAG: adenylate/guanylate cyclase domain-containing protein [Actinomycetota bacterium]
MEDGGNAREPAERKLVTVLFCDLVGSTALGERLDPEGFQAVLGAYFDRMRKLSESFGGIVEKFIGDAVVTVFGIPNVHEDDAERAVRCALAMHDALAGLNDTLRPRFGVELVTRIGINTGVALASPEALATGDVMNTAARLEQAASPGEILVGRETMMLTREIVEFGVQRPVEIKGKAEPMQGWPAQTLSTRRMRPRAPFVGRKAELEALTAVIERAIRDEKPQVVAVIGEPGIGKTRLVDEFAARTTGRAAVYRGSCPPYGESSPWMPVIEIVRAEAQISDLDPPDAAARKLRKRLESRHPEAEVPVIEAQLAPLLGAFRRTAPSGPELVWALRRYMEGLAQEGPTVLVLDNLQWGAQTLMETVLELADTIDRVPLVIFCSGRSELRDRIAGLLGQEHTALVTLDALSSEHSRALIANLREQAGASWADHVEQSIAARGQGNPLFLEEIAAMAAEEGGAGGIPHSLQALISARLDLLASEAKRVAQCSAAIGDVFWDAAVWSVSGTDGEAAGVATALRVLRTRGFVEEQPSSSFLGTRQFRFHHALIREVAYSSISKADRFRMHRAAAEWLDERAGDRPEFFSQIALHFIRAMELSLDVRPLESTDETLVEAALASFVRAGHQAAAVVAYEEAARWYSAALLTLENSEDDPALRCNLTLSLGDVRIRAGESVLARTAFLDAANLAREHRMGEQMGRAAVGFGGGQTFDIPPFTVDDELVALLEEALEILGDRDSGMRARVLGRLAVALYFSEEEERRVELGREAVDMARRVNDTGALAYALSARRFALWGPETLDERLEVATEILELAQSVGDRDLTLLGHRWRIVSLLELGDLAAVAKQIDDYAALAEELKQPYQLWFAEVFGAMRASLEGRLDDAETLMQRALEIGSRTQGENAVQFFAAQLMTLREHQGRLLEMQPAIRAYAEQFPDVLAIRAALSYIYAMHERDDDSRAAFEQAAVNDFADIPRDTTWLLTLTMLTQTCARLGDRGRAKILYDLFVPYASRTIVVGPAIACFGSAARYLGILAATIGRRGDAERHFADAVEMNERMHARPYLAHSLREYGELLATSADPAELAKSEELLERAAGLYAELGMTSFRDLVTAKRNAS